MREEVRRRWGSVALRSGRPSALPSGRLLRVPRFQAWGPGGGLPQSWWCGSPVFSSPHVWKKSLNPDPEGRGYPRPQVRKLPGQSPLTQELHGNRKERKERQERGQLHGPGLILFLQGWRAESRENQDSEGAGSPCPSPPLCTTG